MSDEKTKEAVLVTADDVAGLDNAVFAPADVAAGRLEGARPVTVDELRELACAARDIHDDWTEQWRSVMDVQLAREIARLRETHTWRALAQALHDQFVASGREVFWDPPSNQLAGMAADEVAKEKLGGHR